MMQAYSPKVQLLSFWVVSQYHFVIVLICFVFYTSVWKLICRRWLRFTAVLGIYKICECRCLSVRQFFTYKCIHIIRSVCCRNPFFANCSEWYKLNYVDLCWFFSIQPCPRPRISHLTSMFGRFPTLKQWCRYFFLLLKYQNWLLFLYCAKDVTWWIIIPMVHFLP